LPAWFPAMTNWPKLAGKDERRSQAPHHFQRR
jgi:hypothetical protein